MSKFRRCFKDKINVPIEHKKTDVFLWIFNDSDWSKFSFLFSGLLFSQSFWVEFKRRSLSIRQSNTAPVAKTI